MTIKFYNMKIHIIRTISEDENNKSGIGYYADFLEEQLLQTGHEVKTTDYELNLYHGFKNLLYNNIILTCIDMIKSRKNTDIVHATAEYCSLFLPLTRKKRIVTFHHVVKDDEIETRYWKIMWRLSALMSKIFADKLIAISPQTKKDMVNILGIKENRITVLMHPPKPDMYVTGAPKEDIFLFIGMFMGRKNPSAAISVFERIIKIPKYKDYKLVMCGNGHMKEELISLIGGKGLTDSVILTSNLSVTELRGLYNKSRVLFNTSYFEGLGITTLESQLCGTPVLFFENAEIPPEVTVAAIPCTSVEDMANKTIELLENDKLMTSVSEKGISFAKGFGKDYKEKLKEIYST